MYSDVKEIGKAVPCLFALLSNEEHDTYQRLATKHVHVSAMHIDVEKGLTASFTLNFPGASILGCKYHWKIRLWERISADNLMVFYNSSWSASAGPLSLA